jgi:phytoene dehydrogenase-like protein
MTLTMRVAVAAVALPLLLSQALAGPIERACNGSNRDAANRSVCSCIQSVADQSLTSTDQRRAAKFFNDPDRAQETRASDTSRDEAFWQRYVAFGQQAEAYCAG